MIYRKLGATGLEVSLLGMGCGGMFAQLCHWAPRDMDRLLRQAWHSGINLFDTADIYGDGESERVVARLLRDVGDRAIVATKGGHVFQRKRFANAIHKRLAKRVLYSLGRGPGRRRRKTGTVLAPSESPGSPSSHIKVAADYSPEYLEAAIAESLARLKVERVDLYQLHSPDPGLAQSQGTVQFLEEMRQRGRIRFWGVSCYRFEDAEPFLKYTGCSSIQIQCNAGNLEECKVTIERARAAGVGVIGRQPFARGDLIGAKAKPAPARDLLRVVAFDSGADSVIAGMSNPAHLQDNVHSIVNAPGTAS